MIPFREVGVIQRPIAFLSVLWLTFLFVPAARSQTSTSTVSGTVRDQSSAVIPAASITLTNTATGVVWRTTSNQAGVYFFTAIVPGPYRLTVESPGLQKFEGALTVQVQQSAVVDAVMKVGQASTEVSVQDVTPQLT